MEDLLPLALKDALKKLFAGKKPLHIPQWVRSQVRPRQASTPKTVSKQMRTRVEESNSVESYALNEPYAYASIVRDPSRGSLTYVVEEPELSRDDVVQLGRLKDLLMEVLDVNVLKLNSREGARKYLWKKSEEVLDHYEFKMDSAAKERLLYYMLRDNLGFGKIDPLMHDPSIEDIIAMIEDEKAKFKLNPQM
jgi:hypothetical protein